MRSGSRRRAYTPDADKIGYTRPEERRSARALMLFNGESPLPSLLLSSASPSPFHLSFCRRTKLRGLELIYSGLKKEEAIFFFSRRLVERRIFNERMKRIRDSAESTEGVALMQKASPPLSTGKEFLFAGTNFFLKSAIVARARAPLRNYLYSF